MSHGGARPNSGGQRPGSAMVGGEIGIAPAQALLSMLGEARQAHELGDIERRLGALEQQRNRSS